MSSLFLIPTTISQLFFFNFNLTFLKDKFTDFFSCNTVCIRVTALHFLMMRCLVTFFSLSFLVVFNGMDEMKAGFFLVAIFAKIVVEDFYFLSSLLSSSAKASG